MDYVKFEKSLKHLEVQLANYQGMADRDDLSELDREAIQESVIQRFETCYDTLWKHLKRHLIEVLGIPELPNSPKPVFRVAAENNLLKSPVEDWFNYADTRVDTAHDYSWEKVTNALGVVPAFLADAIDLYQRMTGKSWA